MQGTVHKNIVRIFEQRTCLSKWLFFGISESCDEDFVVPNIYENGEQIKLQEELQNHLSENNDDIQVNFHNSNSEKVGANLPEIKLEVLGENDLGIKQQSVDNQVKTEIPGLFFDTISLGFW